MSKPILTDDQRQQINTAIARAESGTVGEIVPVVLSASDAYPGARWRLAVALALGISSVLALAIPFAPPQWSDHPWTADPMVAVAMVSLLIVAGHFLAGIPGLLRLALSRGEIEEEVRQRARELFLDRGLHTTQGRSGVLILISLLEHRIEIICDEGIHNHAPKDFWDDMVAGLREDIKGGRLTEGLVAALGKGGQLLTEHFPLTDDAPANELPDEVITD